MHLIVWRQCFIKFTNDQMENESQMVLERFYFII